jgi:uncharacterized protein DUF3850
MIIDGGKVSEMSKTHVVKLWPEMFDDVASGVKSFDLRRNDRDYLVGDLLVMQEFDPKSGRYTGRETTRRVSYVMHGAGPGCIEPLKGLAINYVILGLAPTDRRRIDPRDVEFTREL